MPSVVLLSICIVVGGRWGPIYSRNINIQMASHALIHSAPISASAAMDITILIIWAMFNIIPLSGENGELFDKYQCTPAPFLPFFI